MEGVCSTIQAVLAAVIGITSTNKATLCLLPPITKGWRLSLLISPKEDR